MKFETDLAAPFFEDVGRFVAEGRRIIASSSFQTQSMPLLHLISQADVAIPVYFLDTGFHFPETLEFRDHVTDTLGLETVVVESPIPKTGQMTTSGMFLFAEDTDRCCHVNKTLPMEPALIDADVWISGVRGDQSSVRAGFAAEMPGPHGVTRYHPMLAWTRADVWGWIRDHDLPRHPLELLGYDSIGCAPCTARPSLDGGRSGRWDGQSKTECGLHTSLVAG